MIKNDNMYYVTHDLSVVQYYENVCWWWCGFFQWGGAL